MDVQFMCGVRAVQPTDFPHTGGAIADISLRVSWKINCPPHIPEVKLTKLIVQHVLTLFNGALSILFVPYLT